MIPSKTWLLSGIVLLNIELLSIVWLNVVMLIERSLELILLSWHTIDLVLVRLLWVRWKIGRKLSCKRSSPLNLLTINVLGGSHRIGKIVWDACIILIMRKISWLMPYLLLRCRSWSWRIRQLLKIILRSDVLNNYIWIICCKLRILKI